MQEDRHRGEEVLPAPSIETPEAVIAIATDDGPQQVIEAIVAALRAREEKTKKARPGHPARYHLVRFMAGIASPTESRQVVQHLLAGCPRCGAFTRRVLRLSTRPRRRHGSSEV